jgi:hypothetical protein
VPRRDRERHRAAGRVADDMEPAETVSVSPTKSPLDLGVEPEVGSSAALISRSLATASTRSPSLSSNGAYASFAGNTPPGSNTTG